MHVKRNISHKNCIHVKTDKQLSACITQNRIQVIEKCNICTQHNVEKLEKNYSIKKKELRQEHQSENIRIQYPRQAI